jgi:hypothetical protein
MSKINSRIPHTRLSPPLKVGKLVSRISALVGLSPSCWRLSQWANSFQVSHNDTLALSPPCWRFLKRKTIVEDLTHSPFAALLAPFEVGKLVCRFSTHSPAFRRLAGASHCESGGPICLFQPVPSRPVSKRSSCSVHPSHPIQSEHSRSSLVRSSNVTSNSPPLEPAHELGLAPSPSTFAPTN